MKRTWRALSPLIILLLMFFSNIKAQNKDVKIESTDINKIEVTEDGSRIETFYSKDGITIYRINTATGYIFLSNEVFEEKKTNKIAVFTTNNANNPDEHKFSESSITKGIPTSLNFDEYLGKNGEGEVRIVIDNDILNKVFEFKEVNTLKDSLSIDNSSTTQSVYMLEE